MFRIFSLALLIPAADPGRELLIKRLMMSTIFGEIWKLIASKQRIERIQLRNRLENCWNDCYEGRKKGPMAEELMHLWMEIQGHSTENRAEYAQKKKEYYAEFLKKNRANLARAFQEVDEFRKFLDKNEGTRGRILEIFNCRAEIEELFFEGSELSPIVKISK